MSTPEPVREQSPFAARVRRSNPWIAASGIAAGVFVAGALIVVLLVPSPTTPLDLGQSTINVDGTLAKDAFGIVLGVIGAALGLAWMLLAGLEWRDNHR